MHPAKHIYPLNEAAKKANREPSDLLHAGAMGDITLLIGVPDGIGLRLLKETTAGRETGEPAPMRTPNILALRRHHCLALELNGKALFSDSPLGYSFDTRLGIKACHPSDCDAALPIFGASSVSWKDPRRRWTAWSIYMGETASQLEVVSERVLVAITEINRYCDVALDKPGNVQEHYKSDYLQFLNQAAFRFWGNPAIVKEDRLTHPKTEKIIEWLEEKGFSPSLAKKAASILRPEFAGTGRLPED